MLCDGRSGLMRFVLHNISRKVCITVVGLGSNGKKLSRFSESLDIDEVNNNTACSTSQILSHSGLMNTNVLLLVVELTSEVKSN